MSAAGLVRYLEKLQCCGRMVKFSHTIFALPFALSMFVFVAHQFEYSWSQLVLIVVSLVSARTAAMTFNRIVDCRIDLINPRTCKREIPSGELGIGSAILLLLFSVIIFLLAAAVLGRHCLYLAPIVLLVLLGYSYAKRVTASAHLILGLALALAPGGVWYAITAQWSWVPVPMMMGVILWVSGFDILYSCQDIDFDREHGLHSIPARFGIENSLVISRLLHVAAIASLALFGLIGNLTTYYFIGLGVFALVVGSQHLLVSASDLSKVNAAFFSRNGFASVIFFLAVLIDRLSN